ncbi:MAG: GNAT family N-acetyltransferase [Bacillus sp. (in: Bacteria)]|nr:GNAT family N-acetyltransferase [Bacillus sp. (in: firmicutes)]
MKISFKKIGVPTDKLIASLNKWENDPKLVPLIHPCRNQDDIESYVLITKEEIKKRLTKYQMYEIYLGDILIGEMNYTVDPMHLYRKERGTAWIAITIGEEIARGRGVGSISLKYLEEEIKKQGLKRIELGVFEFNKNAHKLYQKLGYQEIGKNKQFTFYQDKMWDDIRMEKYT